MRLTKRQRELRDKYTTVGPLVGMTGCKLVVGNQSFGVAYGNRRQCEWWRRMLAVALDRLVERECAAKEVE